MRVLAVFLALLACQVSTGYRILGLFPLHGKSHWIVMETLMRALAKRGHQLDVVTHFPSKSTLPNHREISIAGSMPDVVNNMSWNESLPIRTLSMKYFAYICGEKVCDLMDLPQVQELIKNPPKDPPYDLVITETFVSSCYLAFGRLLNVPVVNVVASSLPDWMNSATGNPWNTAYVRSLFSQSLQEEMTFYDRLMNTLVPLFTMSLTYYISFQKEQVKKYMGLDIDSMDDLYQDLALTLVNSHHSLHGVRPWTPAVVEVGGLHIEDKTDPLPPEIQKWLDESKHGCVYVSFGSMLRFETFPNETIMSFYRAFEKIAPVRVLMKIARKEDLPPGLPKNVITYHWLPQLAVLRHNNTRAFVTHGGNMGTLESLSSGVPMIGVPVFGDQYGNINVYVRKKVAISVGSVLDVTEEKLTNALKEILKDPSYRENIRRLSELFRDRPMSAMDTAIYWIEYVARHGKVLQSPAIRLSWWKLNLIDVYGAIILALVIVLYILLRILRVLKNLVFGRSDKKDVTRAKKNK